MKLKNIVLATALLGTASSAMANGYVISFEAEMRDQMTDTTETILNLEGGDNVYEECYNAGKPLMLQGKLYVDMNKAPEAVKPNDYQGKYDLYNDQYFYYELNVPDTAFVNLDPSHPDYCVNPYNASRSKLFIGSTDLTNPEDRPQQVRKESTRAYLIDDYQRYSYKDPKDQVWFKANRDIYIQENDHAYRHWARVTLNLQKYTEYPMTDLIDTHHFLHRAIEDLTDADLSENNRHIQDKHELVFDYSRYIRKDGKDSTLRTKFRAMVSDITSVENVDTRFRFEHIECVGNLSDILTEQHKHYCF